jgi:hypothetical protein
VRSPRKTIDEEAGLSDPAAHRAVRPGWKCEVDGEDWPCQPLRDHLSETMPAVEISMVMTGPYGFALIELSASPMAVWQRFLGWIKGPTPPVRWHAPGGPW